MTKDSLGDRIKTNYEDAYRIHLPKRMPVILRCDGKNFHSITKHLPKPFDPTLCDIMDRTAKYLCENMQGAKLAYVQSDEISILVTNYDQLTTDSWFDNNLQKMVSIASALASSYFTASSTRLFSELKLIQFDARAFVVPKEEVNNELEKLEENIKDSDSVEN